MKNELQESDLSEKSTKKVDKKKKIIIGVLALGLAVSAASFLFYENSRVYGECYVEAGVEVDAQDFLRVVDEQAYFVQGSDTINSAVPGEYHVIIQTGFFPHNSTLYITDSIAPTGEGKRVIREIGKACEAALFVDEIEDATAVTVSYLKEPDFEKPGIQEVTVVLTDAGGNQTEVASELFVSQVVEELTIEVGSRPPVLKDFVIAGENASLFTKVEEFDYTVPAEKKVRLRVDGTDYTVKLHITDTVAPKLVLKDVRSVTKAKKKPEDFVVSVEDATQVSLSFQKAPDIMKTGEQTIVITAVDLGGNETKKAAKLTLEVDTEPPVINGVEDLTVLEGSSIFYKKNVTVTDNYQEGLTLTVDNSAVNLSVTGEYPITYIARDAAGNETRASAKVIVETRIYDMQKVYELADSVIAKIITPEMTELDKVQAIYRYNTSHIAYINHSEKTDWVRAAYEGLIDRKGDCYVYASTAKVLLDRAGIHNMDIAKIPAKTSHYWNLVNLGDGWYHLDTTPRVGHPVIFMWTEAQLMEYSRRNDNSHNYDHTLYPIVN